MKSIVVYFSLDGNSEYAADKISEEIEADKLRLEPIKSYPKGGFSKYFWGGKSVIFGEKPKLASYNFDADKYDTIIIGTPIWAGSFAPPVKTFLRENNLSGKRIALFACSASGDAEKCFGKLKREIPGCNIVETLSLVQPKVKQSEENNTKIREFCNKLAQ